MEEPKREPGFDRSLFDAFSPADDAATSANPVQAFWKQIERDPREWNNQLPGYDKLMEDAANATREDLRRTLAWVEGALGYRDRPSAVAGCRYLTAMPDPLLASDYPRLLNVFNSRKVGMVWRLTPDLDKTPLPRGAIPVFGAEAGFGLIRHAPELYVKLSMLGPEMEEVVVKLVDEAAQYDVLLPPNLMALGTRGCGPSQAGTPI